MSRFAITLACILSVTLAACGGSLAPVAASLTPIVLPAAQVAQLWQTCQVAAPLLSVAAQPNMPATVSETATYGAAYCGQLLAGSVPATTDANTPRWLPAVITAVKIAAAVAGVVLPML